MELYNKGASAVDLSNWRFTSGIDFKFPSNVVLAADSYADTLRRTETNEATGDEAERTIPFLKAYTVFNVEQVEGLPAHFYARAEHPRNSDERIADAETFFAATRADIRHGGDCAYYSPTLDYIQMPVFEAFRDAQAYYATLAHEATHWPPPYNTP